MKLDLNALRAQTLEHLDSLWQEQYSGGGFAERTGSYVSLMGTNDATWIFHMLQANDRIEKYGDAAASWLLAQQKKDGHFICDVPAFGAPGYRHSMGHSFWMAMRALNIYGSDLKEFPPYLAEVRTAEQLDQWFALSDWQSPESNHHDVLGMIPILVSHPDQKWEDTFYRNLGAQQDLITFTWCDNKEHRTNVSRTFAYCAMHIAAGRIPPNAEKLIDTILKIQRDLGIWETRVDFPEYHTMDATYILWRLGNKIGYPWEPRREALIKVSDAMNAYLASRPINKFDNTHLLAANLHTLGLLQEALPERYETQIPWRFDWDKADMFFSKAIKDSYIK